MSQGSVRQCFALAVFSPVYMATFGPFVCLIFSSVTTVMFFVWGCCVRSWV